MYDLISKTLEKKGFIHYEVSNFAKKNKESKHNLTYWANEEYYGFGLGASGYIDGVRYTNTRNIWKYLQGEKSGTSELLNQREQMNDELMLGLRKLAGVNLQAFKEKYGLEMSDAFPIKPLLKNGDLKQKNGNILIPKEKIYIMNEILEKMI